MSLFNTIKTGASGLGASGSSLAVIGDNIANLNTRGFKRGRIAFADVMPQYIGSVNGVSQVGRGATTSNVSTMHLQGGFQSTGSALDMAIGGDGFFQVQDGQRSYFTRDGSFQVDKNDFVTTLGGMRLMGYPARDGVLSGQAGPLQLQTTPLPSRETGTITVNAMLTRSNLTDDDGDGAVDTPLAGRVALATGAAGAPSIAELTEVADWSTSITVYDSLGQPHQATLLFEQTGPSTWNQYTVVDGSEIDGDGDGLPDAPDGGALAIGEPQILTFDTGGNLVTVAGSGTPFPDARWPGADPWSPTVDYGQNNGSGSIRANGESSAAISIQQDGYATAYLTSLSVQGDGTIMGQYDNGESQILGQVALARFPANQGLGRVGGNLYEATLQSGDPTLGVPGTGGRGELSGYALESSNVDLEDEFVSMIQSQRAYQANASTIRASDESLQTLVQLV